MRVRLGLIGTGCLLALATYPVHSHHSFAAFDQTRTVQIRGSISEFQWSNPHVWLHLSAVDTKTNQPVEWALEGPSPNALRRVGWLPNSLKVGDQVTVSVRPMKDGSNRGGLVQVEVNGKILATTPAGGD